MKDTDFRKIAKEVMERLVSVPKYRISDEANRYLEQTQIIEDYIRTTSEKAYKDGWNDAVGECANHIDGMDIDDVRCRKLQLTEQAWEEALQSASKAIRLLRKDDTQQKG